MLTECRSDDLRNHGVETAFVRIVPKAKTI